MALPVIENNSSIVKSLNENADRLEEIKQLTVSGPTTDLLSLNQQTLDEIKVLLSSQLDLDKQTAELQRLQIENQENAQRENELEAERAARLARESAARQAAMQGGTGATASSGGGNWLATALGIGGGAAASGGLVAALRSGLASTLKNVFKGGLLIGLGDMFGDEIGKFLGENVATVLDNLGTDPAFGEKIGEFLTEKAGGIIADAGWAKLLFGRTLPGIIASTLVQSFGLPSLSDPAFMDEVGIKIGDYFGEEAADMFGGAAETAGEGAKGALAGYLTGGVFKKILGPKGKIIGAIAGFLFDYFNLTSLADPAKQDEIADNIKDEMGISLGGVGAIGATLLGPAAVAATVRRVRGRPSGGSPAPDTEATTKAPTQSRAEVAQRAARTLTPSQLEASGLRRVGQGAGATIQRVSGGFASQTDIIAAAERSATSRFPRLALLKRIPGIGSIVALTDLYFILNDDTTTNTQKSILIAGVFGGIGGATLGTIVGALAGAPGGPAAIATSIIGGTIGYFAGNAAAQLLAKHIADWILGDVNDIDKLPQPIVDQVIDPAIQNAAPAQSAPPALNPAPGNQTAAAQNQSSARTSQSQTPSLPSVGSLDTSALSSLPSSTDLQSMDLTRQRIDRKYEGITKALNQAMGLSEEGRPANEVAAEALEAVQEASAQGLLSDTILEPQGTLGEETLRAYTADQRKSVADMFTNHKEKVDAFLSLDTKSQELVLDRPQIEVLRNVSRRLGASVERINAVRDQPPAQAISTTPALPEIPVPESTPSASAPSAPDTSFEYQEADQQVVDTLSRNIEEIRTAESALPENDPERLSMQTRRENLQSSLENFRTTKAAERPSGVSKPVVTDSLVQRIKQLEGFSAIAFEDNGNLTIGYGTPANSMDEQITEVEAEVRLRQRLEDDIAYVDKYSRDKGYNWSPQQTEALTSFVYNLGRGSLDQLTQSGSRTNVDIAKAIPLYNKASGRVMPGLVDRRQQESALFAYHSPAASNELAQQQPTKPAGTDQLVTDLGVLQRAANALPADDPRRMEYENEIQNKTAQLRELYTVTTATASAIPPVDRNEVSELSKQLSTSSQVVIAQPVTNIVNNINNDNSSTSVASSGSGTNIPSGRTYNIDSSLTRVNRGRVYA
jgi:lysozyme